MIFSENRFPLFGIMLYLNGVAIRETPMRLLALVMLFSISAAALADPPVAPSSTLRPPPAPPSAPRPYQAVAIKLPLVPQDPSFEIFRDELASIAKGRIYAELKRLVIVQSFFWDRDFKGGFDRQQSGVDNLAAAIRLERRNGMGWGTLAAFAAKTTASPLTGRPGIICAPGEPSYDGVEFDRLIDVTRSNARGWAAPRADKTDVRAAPRINAAVIETLGPALVRVFGYLAKDNEPDTLRAAWARVATPSGRIGLVAPGMLISLTPERLCYGKDGFGRWRIAGYVGGEE
jgi:hypothetical protein